MKPKDLNFYEFSNDVGQEIRNYLPRTWQEASVEVREVRKLNETYIGMQVYLPGDYAIPVVNLKQYYQKYLLGFPFEKLMEQMAELVQMEMPDADIRSLTEYDKIKDRLFVRLCSVEGNEAFLKDVVHDQTDGLAAVCSLYVGEKAGGILCSSIQTSFCTRFQVSPEQIMKDAKESMAQLFPVWFESLKSVVRRMESLDVGESAMEPEEAGSNKSPMMVLGNQQSVYGASVIMCPGVLDQVAKELQGDLLILPSSIHEVLVVPDNGSIDYRELQDMVQEINRTTVELEDRLSDYVYHYDAAEQILEKAETHEMRKKLQQEMGKMEEHGDQPREKDVGSASVQRPPETKERPSVMKRLEQKKEQMTASQPQKAVAHKMKETVR